MIRATIRWEDSGGAFNRQRYSRAHTWSFDGGAEIAASSSPDIVPVPMSDASAVDPEEALIASVASCHMLWFLSLAAKEGFVVREYRDDPVGEMRKNSTGKLFIAVVTLRPRVVWDSNADDPDTDQIQQLHDQAHQECFIANSIHAEIRIET